MTTILTGQFDDFEVAENAQSDLRRLGVAEGQMQVFEFNAPGQHDRNPLGGDEYADRSAQSGGKGAVTGAAVGGVAGLALGAAAIPLAGPLAAAAGFATGAYVGSFAGAVGSMGEEKSSAEVPPRPAGLRIVVHTTRAERQGVLSVFRRHGARSIEEASGTWRDGSWADFDPLAAPHWIDPPGPSVLR